jgi:hypothetical protein
MWTMVQTSQQFTPQQLLEAGHRAEGEGKFDLAAQFYRHLTEHYSYTAEAAEARNGLGRVGATQSQIWHTNGASNGHSLGLGAPHITVATSKPNVARAPRRRPVAPRDYYRTGRALAALVSGFGWLMVLLGMVLPAVAFVPGAGLPPLGLAQLIGGATGLCIAGLFIVFCGQAARALFDQANATRELVALERAKIGHD